MMRLSHLAAAALLAALMPIRGYTISFEEEFELAVRAGRGKILYEERQELEQRGHALLTQMRDPNAKPLLKLFSDLPDQVHARLKERRYLAWKFADLSEKRQEPFRDFVKVNDALSRQHHLLPIKGFSLEELEKSRVGFVIVELPAIKQRVVSWFILWPSLDTPSWVTLVNVNAVGSPRYMDAHTEKLRWVRSQALSPLPVVDE